MTLGERCYRLLIRLYPARFRERFENELLHVYREDAQRSDVRWSRVAFDAVGSALLEHVAEIRRRRACHTSIASHEHHQSNTGDGMFSVIVQDLRYAIRGLRRQPSFTIVVLATLALGIGANTAIFSVINGILLRPLPYATPERIVYFNHEPPFSSVSDEEFLDYKREMRTFDQLAAFSGGTLSLTSGEEPVRVQFTRASEDFYTMLGATPALGRLFSTDEFTPGAPLVILLSHALWSSHFGSDSSLVGRDIQVNGRPFRVIGVLPSQFTYPTPANGLWTPMRLDPENLFGRNNHYMNMIGRLAPGVSIAAARTEARTIGAQLTQQYPETYGKETLVPKMVSLADSITGRTRPFLVALLGAVGFVLLIACVNVANLFLARGESRRKEVAIRAALGASRGRLSAQFLTESLLCAVLGGVLGVFLAWGGQQLLVASAPASIPRLDEVHLDGEVLLFTSLLVLITGLAFGLYPALRIARGKVGTALREGGRTGSTAATPRLRRLLVVSEVALAVMMLAGAGIMLRSLWKLQATDLGFDATNVMTAQLSLPFAQYDTLRRVAFYEAVTTRLAASPGVSSAAAVMTLPIEDGGNRWSIMIDNIVLRNIGDSPSAAPQQITPDFLRTMGIPIVTGRGFTAEDRRGTAPVALVNEALARQLWKNENPVGRTIKLFSDRMAWATVVGVVKDTRAEGLLADVPPTMYFPHGQADQTVLGGALTMSIVAKTTGKPEAIVPRLREIVREMDPAVPITKVQSLEQVVSASIADRRFSTSLLALFAALALALAGIGIYGVIAYGVSQRTQEIGVRVALGAQRWSVASVVLRQSLVMTGVGIAVGLTGAVAIAWVARSMLVGVAVFDPATLVTASVLIVMVALLGCLVPLRRALSVDPVTALRSE